MMDEQGALYITKPEPYDVDVIVTSKEPLERLGFGWGACTTCPILPPLLLTRVPVVRGARLNRLPIIK